MNRGILTSPKRTAPHTGEVWRSMGGVTLEPVQSSGSSVGAPGTWPASANTLTGWTEIVASSPYDCCALDVVIQAASVSTADSAALFDIGVGADGAETVLIDGIPVFGRLSGYPTFIRFYVRRAGGTRFAWRMQAATGSATITGVTPAVGLGFIRDIPEFPSGSAVHAIGTIDRAASTYTNISNGNVSGGRRERWATVGDLPAGKVIWLTPIANCAAGSTAGATSIIDWGWHRADGLGANAAVAGPDEILAAETVWFTESTEIQDNNIQTIWLGEDGYRGGSIVAAADSAGGVLNKWMCFAVTE